MWWQLGDHEKEIDQRAADRKNRDYSVEVSEASPDAKLESSNDP